jgi:hypothetical protein
MAKGPQGNDSAHQKIRPTARLFRNPNQYSLSLLSPLTNGPHLPGPRHLLLPQAKFTPVTEPTAPSPPPSIPLQCLPDPTPPRAYKKPSPSSPFPLFLQYPRRPRAAGISRRSPLPPLLEIADSDEVTQPRPLSLASFPSFSFSASPDDLRSS